MARYAQTLTSGDDERASSTFRLSNPSDLFLHMADLARQLRLGVGGSPVAHLRTEKDGQQLTDLAALGSPVQRSAVVSGGCGRRTLCPYLLI